MVANLLEYLVALFTVHALSSVLLDFVILDEWPMDTAEFLKTRLKPSSCFTEDLIDCLGAGGSNFAEFQTCNARMNE